MKKATALVGIILYDLMISLLANALGFTTSGEVIQDLPSNVENNVSSFFNTLDFFWNLLLFNVSGDIPDLIATIFFYLPNVFLWILLLFIIFNRGD